MERAGLAFRERTTAAVHLFAFGLRHRVPRPLSRGPHPVRLDSDGDPAPGLYGGAHSRRRESYVFAGGINEAAPLYGARRYGFAFATRARISRSFAFTLAAFSRPMRSNIFCPAERDWRSGSAYS